MHTLIPLPVAMPLLGAALVTVLAAGGLRRVGDVLAILTAAAAFATSLALLLHGRLEVYWLGGWTPRHGLALGIDLAVDPVGAGLAALAGLLVTTGLVYSWRYYAEAATLYTVLMLVFLGAMDGFVLTGDLFNMFVFFELMGAAAYALTGHKVEDMGPLQGAFNFAVSNTVGAFMILFGLGILYARTGALNLAQLGATLPHRADGPVIVAFALLLGGFFVKAAIVPFHFWLADAHAVAPPTVCILFSGIMVELGLYAVARVYWTVFAGSLGAPSDLRELLLATGALTAVVGAAMCFLQRHVKRLLAFSTVAHAGIMLMGIALLSAGGLAGFLLYLAAHGLAKAALFLAAGTLLNRLGTIDELRLRGRGMEVPGAAFAFVVGGFAVVGMPPLGTALGKSLIEEAAGRPWVTVVLTAAAAVSAGTILRAAGRIFAGWGADDEPLYSPEAEEHPDRPSDERSTLMLSLPAAVMAVAALLLPLVPGLHDAVEQAAARFVDHREYVRVVLHGAPATAVHPGSSIAGYTGAAVAIGLAGLALAVALAAAALAGRRLPRGLLRAAAALLPPLNGLRGLHSGAVGDYVALIVAGAAVLGGACAAVLR